MEINDRQEPLISLLNRRFYQKFELVTSQNDQLKIQLECYDP